MNRDENTKKTDSTIDTLDLAVHETAHNAKGGLGRLAEKMSMSAQVLINKVNYHNVQNKLSLREAVKMMQITNDVSVLEEVARMLDRQVKKKTQDTEKSLLSAIVNASADHGKVHQTIESAFIDKKITSREFQKISKEVHDAIDALHILLATLEHTHEEDIKH